MSLKKFTAAGAALVLSLGLAACGSDDPAAEGDAAPTPISVYYTSPLAGYSIIQVADDHDLFPDDIDVSVEGGDSTVGVTLASSGRVQMYLNTAPMTENIAHGGAALAWAATWTEGMNTLFIGRNGVESLEDMKGRSLGIVQPGLTLSVIANDALIDAGLSQDDYKSVSLGTVPALAGAFAAGTVDGAVLDRITAERLLSEVDGSVELFDYYDGTPFVGGGVSVNTDWLEENPEAATSFLEGLQAALDFMSENPEEAKKSISAMTGITEADALDNAYQDFMDHSTDTLMPVSEEQMNASMRMLRNEGNDWATDEFGASVVIDPSYVEQALER